LAQFPLGALSTSPDRYEPLITRCDVAWVRFHAPSAREATGPPLVIVEPEYAPGVRRRYTVLQQPLSQAAVEAEHAAAAFPPAVVLRGSEATKPAVLARAIDAPVVYVASHFVQDPEVPYVAFIPLAAPSPERVDESYLELSDIRGVDLSKCRLVVLSGCGSGRAYVATKSSCPSLAEVLVDAGARAVVHTYDDVRDEDAEALMSGFLDALRGDPDPVHALAVAQRAAYAAGRPPSKWATYSITLGTLAPSEYAVRIPQPEGVDQRRTEKASPRSPH
jgi:CHAT domain-containing protein